MRKVLRWTANPVGLAFLLIASFAGTVKADAQADLIAAYNQGNRLQEQAKHAEAAAQYDKALALALRVYGENHLSTDMIVANLGFNCMAQGQYVKAEAYFQRSLAVREKLLGKDHDEVAKACSNLAKAYKLQSHFDKSEQLYGRALKIWEERHGRNHINVAAMVVQIAELHQMQKQYERAEPLFVRGIEIVEALSGPNHPTVASALDRLGNLYKDQAKYDQAESLFRRSLKIREAAHGPVHESVARSVIDLGDLFATRHDFATAESLYLRGLKINEQVHGKDHHQLAWVLESLAVMYKFQGKFMQAEPYYLRALNNRETGLGKAHYLVAGSLNDLAILYENQGKFAQAEPLFQQSLKIRETNFGKDHPLVAASLDNLGLLYRQSGNFAQAEPLLLRALNICETVFGTEHPRLTITFTNLTSLYMGQGRFAEAVPLQARMRRNARSYFLRELPGLSPREQQDFIDQTESTSFATALTVATQVGKDEAGTAAGAEWLLNGKALGVEAQVLGTLLERRGDPAIIRQLNELRAREAALALRVAEPNQREALTKLRDELESKRRGLEKQVAGSELSADKLVQPWIDLNAVRKAIPKESVLVEIARFRPFHFEAKLDDKRPNTRYVAWVIPPAGAVKMVDLGGAEPIEAALKQVRAAMAAAPKRVKEIGEKQASAELTEHSQKLSDLVLKPLLPHLDKAKQLILSPDGELWLAPWAALPVAKDRFLIEDYSLRYVISGRDLVATPTGKQLGTAPALMLADPDFDAGPGAAGATKGGNDRGFSNDIARLPQFARLPGTAAEAEAVGPKMQLLTGSAPTLLTDDKATEAVVKAAKRPKMLTLSTHGFFLPTQVTEIKDRDRGEGSRSASLTKEGQPVENPLLRCGLLLAGCNRRSAAKPGEDDGVLTGLEITGIDLRGCEMVVLSACETGLGDIRSGEGVAGLRQAFQLAGAETVVASLWQVPDRDTALLMARFFDNLAAKKGKAEALREAQIGMIKQRRERGDAAHPYFWAAFTVTGGE